MSTYLGKTSSFEGLGTDTYVIQSTGPHYFNCQTTILVPTGLTITMNLNGSSIASVTVPASNAQFLQLETKQNATAGDILTLVLTSSVATDVIPNIIKSQMVIEAL